MQQFPFRSGSRSILFGAFMTLFFKLDFIFLLHHSENDGGVLDKCVSHTDL